MKKNFKNFWEGKVSFGQSFWLWYFIGGSALSIPFFFITDESIDASTGIALFTILILRILILSEKQTSRFSRIVGYSLSSILFAHILINISMTIGLMPVIGIPLPFFSYGGSALLSFSILLFVFIKLDTYRIERF